MSNLTEYGKFIRKLRIDKNINQKEHAELLGVSATFLSSIEKGKKAYQIKQLSEAIKIHIDCCFPFFFEGSATLSISSNNRSSISYNGEIFKIEKKGLSNLLWNEKFK